MHAAEGIRAFWDWWTTARHRVLHAIEGDHGFSQELVEDISARVAAIGDLDWELGAGTTSRHAFYLSPKGDPELRLVTELWRSLAPPADEEWSYFPARQPRRGLAIELEGVRVDPDALRVRFEIEEARERVDAAFWHPAFAELGEGAQVALFLLLDGELGEDGVERWLGVIELLEEDDDECVPFAELRAAVDELARTATGEQFAVLQGETETGPLFVTANLALKRIDHLLHTRHLAVTVAVLDKNEHGLPTEADAAQLNALEDELTRALGAHVVYFGRETRPGRRTMHWYTPEDSPVQGIAEDWARAHPARAPEVMVQHDPSWELANQY